MRFTLFCLCIACVLNSTAQDLTSGGKLKPEQAIMDVRHYTIALTVDTAAKTVNGYTTIDVVLSEPAKLLLFDLMNNLQVQATWIMERKLLLHIPMESLQLLPPVHCLQVRQQ